MPIKTSVNIIPFMKFQDTL